MNFKQSIIFIFLIILFSPLSVGLSEEGSVTEGLVAKIDIPTENSLVRANVPIFGLAYGSNFEKYRVEYGEGSDPKEWIEIITSTTPQREDVDINEIAVGDQTIWGNLATWDTGLSNYIYGEHPVDLNGIYTVRLLVFGKDGKKKKDKVTVEVGRVIPDVYGGIVESKDKRVILKLPEQSMQEAFKVFGIKPVSSDKDVPIPKKHRLVGNIYTIRPQGERFVKDATLKFKYSDDELNSQDEENKIGIYAYNPDAGNWQYLTTTSDTKNNILTTSISSITSGIAYYCILAREKPPSPPLLYEAFSPTPLKLIAVKGEADINTEVEIFVNGKSQGKVTSDKKMGVFTLENVLLKEGKNIIKAKAIDPFKQSSPFSKSVVCYVATHSPEKIKYLRFMEDDFLHPKDEIVGLGDKLYIELKGEDINPRTIDATDVKLLSENTDPEGIRVQLLEIGYNTGIYRGIAIVSKSSSRREKKIGLRKHNEAIKIISIADPSKQDKVVFSDSMPPSAPKIISKTHPSLIQSTFENGFGFWRNRDKEKGAALSLESAKNSTDNHYLKLTNQNYGGNFASTIISTPFNVKEYPLISFDYKIPPEVKINFLVKVNKKWYEVEFTDEPKGCLRLNIENIGKIKGVIADNKWHTAEFNLYQMLKQRVNLYTVKEIVMADWDEKGYMKLAYGSNKKGATYFIDNFRITRFGSNRSDIEFTFNAEDDLSKNLEYSFCLDNNEDTIPDTISEGANNSVSYSGGRSNGEWYFHVRAKDEAGNWGRANHYWLRIDTKGPIVDLSNPANGSYSAKRIISLHLTDRQGSGVDPQTIKLKINNKEYNINSSALNYSQFSENLTFNCEDAGLIFNDKERVKVKLTQAKDFCGNSIEEPFTLNFVMDYSKDTIKPNPPKIYHLVSYKEDRNMVSFSWESDEAVWIKGYSFLIDQNQKTLPDESIEQDTTSKSYTDLEAGVWYFHIRCQDKAGNWSMAAHCKIIVEDTKDKSIIMVDDFNKAKAPNNLGGEYYFFTNPNAGGECEMYYHKKEKGYSLALKYKVLGPEDYAGYWTSLDGVDLRDYNSLTFWVRNIDDNKLMRVGLKDSSGHEPKVHICGFLTNEYRDNWRKVSIPLSSFTGIKKWSKIERLSFAFENWIGMKEGILYIDDIHFSKQVAISLMVDNFDDGREPNFVGGGNWVFSDGFARIQADYFKNLQRREKDHLYCYRISYAGVKKKKRDGTPGTYCGYLAMLNDLDISKYNSLTFWIKGKSGNEKPNIYLDDGTNVEYVDNHLDLENYVTITTSWQKVNISLMDFVRQGVDISQLEMFKIVFEGEDMDGVIFIDDIEFITKLEF